MSNKGQVFSSDFLTASAIFLVVTGVLLFYWVYSSKQIEESRSINDMTEKTYLLSELWLREGTPKYWDASTVIDLGLQNDHRFNQTKLNALSEIGYSNVKNMVGVGNYDFLLRMYDTSNNTLFSFGLSPVDAENIVRVKRVGILNRSVVFVETVVWGD